MHRGQRHPRPGAPGSRGRRRTRAGPGGARVHLREGGGEVASDIGGGGRWEEIAGMERDFAQIKHPPGFGYTSRSTANRGASIYQILEILEGVRITISSPMDAKGLLAAAADRSRFLDAYGFFRRKIKKITDCYTYVS